jgi:hypothetical protein
VPGPDPGVHHGHWVSVQREPRSFAIGARLTPGRRPASPRGQVPAGAGVATDEAGTGVVGWDALEVGVGVAVGVRVQLGVGLAESEGLAVLDGPGDRLELGGSDGVTTGTVVAGVTPGWTVPADPGTGRTRT